MTNFTTRAETGTVPGVTFPREGGGGFTFENRSTGIITDPVGFGRRDRNDTGI
jgi:hypothetical protein